MEEHILYGDMTEEDLNRSYESLGCMLYRSLKIKGSEIFQIDAVTGKSQTHNDVLHLSCNLAQNLKLKGLKSGDVITICCENRLEYAIPLFATLYIGVVCSPLNPAYTTDELIHSLKITRPKYLFCSEQTLPTVIAAVKRCHFITELVLISDSSVPEYNFNYKIIMFSNLIKPLHPLIRIDDFKPEEFDSHLQTAVVLCSSGTTGLPKGVKLSCANLETFIRGAKSRHSSGETERLLGLVPFYHGYGYGMILTSAVTRLQMILLSKFEEHLFLSTIEKYKINVLPMVPPLMVFLAKHPLVDKFDLSSIKTILCGAAPCGENVIKEVMKRLGIKFIRQGYGMTELTIVVTIAPEGSNKFNSVGKLVEEAQGKVIDIENGTSLGPGAIGELCFRGPQVMQGYFNNERATKDAVDSDGWLHTGDLGYYDEEGYFYIVDRLKELIKYKGYQVAPAELEALILSLPEVKDVAVIGLPDEISGELPLAFVVKQPDSDISENDIIKFVASKVSPQKRLKGGVKFIDAIPKNPSGKILRRLLRDSLKIISKY
ncbi:luciferin 4-monooxygenase-like isoform X1 [Lycorma delicatula]|uniref:luciferin 4-monooxygenase-like isoform X1 n=1 Tax=Lycorma delicatula TaxID=130591 RepID=UPI003F513AB8